MKKRNGLKGKKGKRRRAGKRAQAKGKSYQKEIADVISTAIGVPSEEFYSSMAGLTGPDASASREAVKRFPFALETKNCKQISMAAWLAEAEANADGVGLPFLMAFKLHGRRRNYAVLELEELLKWVT